MRVGGLDARWGLLARLGYMSSSPPPCSCVMVPCPLLSLSYRFQTIRWMMLSRQHPCHRLSHARRLPCLPPFRRSR
ncbi:hypothetical protein OH77DRAFT_707280 [Trametes cingulata]|nr:hypothetical protein OH77DRAFT_707280 [Trametes cingulata]